MSKNQESQSEANSYESILYAFIRSAASPEDLENIKEALEAEGFRLEASEGEGNQIMIQRPKEASDNAIDLEDLL